MSLHSLTKEVSSLSLGQDGNLENQNDSPNADNTPGGQFAATGSDPLNSNILRYHVGVKLGEGSFGIVYAAVAVSDHNKLVAIKFDVQTGKPRTNHKTQLEAEDDAYEELQGCEGIPNKYLFGMYGPRKILILDRLGPSLGDLFDHCKRKFSLKTVIMIGRQMISRVETMHQNGFIHRDIKPQNFLIYGRGIEHPNMIFIIDLAMAERYRCSETGEHIPESEGVSVVGTERYMSINTHLRKQQSRRDDLEAVLYVLFYFKRGRLPWQVLEGRTKEDRSKKIIEMKEQMSAESLCHGQPAMFVECLNYIHKLEFNQDPDYDHLRGCLTKALNGEVEDDEYDWGTWSLSDSPSPFPSSSQIPIYVGSTEKKAALPSAVSGNRLEAAKNMLTSLGTNASRWISDPFFGAQSNGPKSQNVFYDTKANNTLNGISLFVSPSIRRLGRHALELKWDFTAEQPGNTGPYDQLMETLKLVQLLSAKVSRDFLRKGSSEYTADLNKGLSKVQRLAEDCLRWKEHGDIATFYVGRTLCDIAGDSEVALEVDETYNDSAAEAHQQASASSETRDTKASKRLGALEGTGRT